MAHQECTVPVCFASESITVTLPDERRMNVAPAAIGNIAMLAGLRELGLSECIMLEDEGLEALTRGLRRLTLLDISACRCDQLHRPFRHAPHLGGLITTLASNSCAVDSVGMGRGFPG
jgi:hypothetical protein